MEPFPPAQQPDEGYSEDPLNPSISSSMSHGVLISGPRTVADMPNWLSRNLPGLPVTIKTQLAMALLDDLPTSVIAEIVERLNPRLYIDFIHYLPAEVCLKILSYLDPASLINVARSCRAWYDLALDQKLWERLYALEGWKTIPSEISAWEEKVNEGLTAAAGGLQRLQSSEDGHIHKKRAISETDGDLEMTDVDRPTKQDDGVMGSSIFGSPMSSFPSFRHSTMTPNFGDLHIEKTGSSSPSKGKAVDRGASWDKPTGRTSSPSKSEGLSQKSLPPIVPSESAGGFVRSTLWAWDTRSGRYRINWKYLYTMRRRLESNWELGKYTNFQLPHPDFPEEGHQECIYSLQFNPEYLVSGSRDKTLRIWNMQTRRLARPPLVGHSGSVLCLQFDADPEEDLIVSGSSDSDVILWKFSTGEVIQKLRQAHTESVLNIRFDKRILVTCSKDKSIKIFNRRPLNYGEPGYPMTPDVVYEVPIHVKTYGFMPELPVVPAYTMIGCLEGHSAAVNAVQIYKNEIVSASGDRHIKVWDWAHQICTRTIVGHNKGIACVQYDGRRIVSGSSDNEVKVFDRPTGLEVASLRAHANLVRTVQAGFGDLPYSEEEDKREARRVDEEFFHALKANNLADPSELRSHRSKPRNAGSSRPEDITAFGASVPPGGGGGRHGRIVSGSYDQSIIIWRRDKEGVWKDAHHLRQEEAAAVAQEQASRAAAAAAGRPYIGPALVRVRPVTATAAAATNATARPTPLQTVSEPILQQRNPQSDETYMTLIDFIVPQGVAQLQQALGQYPGMLAYHSYLQSVIDREPSPFMRSQLRQTISTALIRAQMSERRARTLAARAVSQVPPIAQLPPSNQALNNAAVASSGSSNDPSGPPRLQRSQSGHAGRPPLVAIGTSSTASAQDHQLPQAAGMAAVNAAAQGSAPTGPSQPQQQHASQQAAQGPVAQQQGQQSQQGQQAPAPAQQQQPHHPHIAAADNNAARIFKLQFDARRIICCSQTSVIVGWDFCNGDEELEVASRFFDTVD